ncbi:MAG: UDP-N-acetylmuramate dehydrogenase [Fusobacteriota bacterium]
MKSYKKVSLKKYSNIKIGGKVKELLFPETILEVKEILNSKKYCEIIGNCSNILFSDNYIDKTFISSRLLKKISKTGEGLIEVLAGTLVSELIQYMRKNNYGGLEPLIGIPATVGGLAYMNGGAHGIEIFDFIKKVEIIDENQKRVILDKNNIKIGYRYTEFKTRDIFITRIFFDFNNKFDESKLNEIMTDRLKKQPLDYPNIGSIFKNPNNDYAARLIENLDLKGFEIGGARISKKHSNFIINTGQATTRDVLELIELIKKEVYKKDKIKLEEEIIRISEEK